jgi:hypothetical protein
MMEAINSFETFVLSRTWCNIPKDGILHSHHSENFKSCMDLLLSSGEGGRQLSVRSLVSSL